MCSSGHSQQAHFGAKSNSAGWPLDSRGVKKAETTVTRSPDLKRLQFSRVLGPFLFGLDEANQ